MKQPIYHKIEDVTFKDISGMECEGIIEQDKSNQSYRLRVLKKRPAVKTVRVRYEPHVELFGDTGAFMPTIWGYNLKRMRNYLLIMPLLMLGLAVTLYPPLWLGLINLVSKSIHISVEVSTILAYVMLVAMYAILVLFFAVPLAVHYARTVRNYLFLKKNAKSYIEREVLLDEIAPKV